MQYLIHKFQDGRMVVCMGGHMYFPSEYDESQIRSDSECLAASEDVDIVMRLSASILIFYRIFDSIEAKYCL